MISTKKAELHLLLITAIWGLTFPLIGVTVKNIPPIHFVTLRFSLAACLILPFVWRKLKNTNKTMLGYGLLLGIMNVGCYWFQGIGLQTLGSSESAFITATLVVMVPFILFIFNHNKPNGMDLISSIICLGGLYILTGANLAGLHKGDFFTLLCAFSCALSIITMQFATHKIHDFTLFVFYQLLFTGLCALPLSILHPAKMIFNSQVVFSLFYCVIFATIIVFYLQNKYQKYTTASKAALIFCAEPIFATFYSWVIFSENITSHVLVGGLIIFISIVIADICKLTLRKFQ